MGILAAAADERVADIGFTDEFMSVELKDGRTISVPLKWYPRLLRATREQRGNWTVSHDGYAIHWPDVDEDLSTEGLLLGLPAAKGTWPIDRKPLSGSGKIVSIGYNPESRILEVEFRNGELYRYLGIPQREYRKLMNARSKEAYLEGEFKKAEYRRLRFGKS